VNSMSNFVTANHRRIFTFLFAILAICTGGSTTFAQAREGGEAALKLPDLSEVTFLGVDGHRLLLVGLLFCFLGLLFGLAIYIQLKNLPVHRSMREISELIYETCKTYLITQGKFILILWVFIAVIVIAYFGVLRPVPGHPVVLTVPIILLFSLVGIGGSYGVAWFGIRVNTFANSRTAFASLAGKPYPIYAIPLKAGMSIGMLLISVELLHRIRDWRKSGRRRIANRGRHLYKDCRHWFRPDEDRFQD
jgi:K(+)-stimulated pyrophosphate-energized sodium pump